MGFNKNVHYVKNKKIDKRFLSKNKSIKIYKEKYSKIESFRQEIAELTAKYDQVNSEKIEKFEDFPLTERTRKALKMCQYITPTEIQKESIMFGLLGKDILGAAKTGSGKTLAFVIPILERLYCAGWTILDGLGALVITPTRELAYQIYDVINKVGKNHTFSVGLVIGGKDLANERKLLDKCNILICTPGRLLQHMDENPLFDAMNLKVLVLDEADRILDMGFEKTMNAILENLPVERQTILYSATQTKSVKNLARCSLKNPVYVSVHENAKFTTPEALQQSYIECEAHDKINLIWSFIKNHKKQKILIFMSTCKQVKYTFESICRLRPGVSVMALYGSLHQLRRMQIYDDFRKKGNAVMFATDIAARGLDFPNVNWVVQLDCPEDVNTYIHRAGRTARYEKGGESLLILLPSEKESMVKQLIERKIPIEEIKANPSKLVSVQRKLEAICARDVNLKDSAQRGFRTYLKSIYLQADKTVFDVSKINFDLYAKSLGLAFAPRVRFLEKCMKAKAGVALAPSSTPKTDSTFTLHASNYSSDDSDDDLLIPKASSDHLLQNEEPLEEMKISKKAVTKAAVAKKILKKKIKPNTIVKFDEEGKPIREICGKVIPIVAADIRKEIEEEGYNLERARRLKEKEDEVDKLIFKEKIRSKHKVERLKKKAKNVTDDTEGGSAMLNTEEASEGNNNEESEDEIDPNNFSASDSDNEEESDQAESRTQSSSEEHSEEEEPRVKRKMNIEDMNTKRRKICKTESSKHVKSSRTLEDDEQLALHFLNNG